MQQCSIDANCNKLFEKLSREPLPIFYTLLFMLIKPDCTLPKPVSQLDFDFNRILHASFVENDNPALAKTLYCTEDGKTISALDRLNEMWYALFSGFDSDGLGNKPLLLSNTARTTQTPIQSNQLAKLMSSSWDRFLRNFPNPESIYDCQDQMTETAKRTGRRGRAMCTSCRHTKRGGGDSGICLECTGRCSECWRLLRNGDCVACELR